MANNYEIDYQDERFQKVEQDKQTALSDLEKTYAGMIDQSDKYHQDQVKAVEQWGEKQTQLQNEQTEFALQEIERQKEDAHKDYIKEQTGAYVDWRKQSNEYGAEAEKMAASGLQNTGYAESSQVSMYNAYQNRVATALESFTRIKAEFDSDMTAARLQNSTILAEIAFETQQKKLELNLAGFQYKNQLLQDKADRKTALENTYYSRYQDVLSQINHENTLAEQVRQYNESLAEERRQYNASLAQQQAELAFEKQKYSDSQKKAAVPTGGSNTKYGKATQAIEAAVKSAAANRENVKTPTNNMQSILALGYGPISESRLASLISSGQVTRTLKNGQYYYSKNISSTSYNRLKNMGLSK